MAEGGIGGSNESFVSFAFAVTSVVLIVLYIPWIISKVRGVVVYCNAPKKSKASMVNPLEEMRQSLLYIPTMLKNIAMDPGMVVAGAKICAAEKIFFIRCVMPKFLKFVIRPRILVLWLWFILFSSAMYATLTFDPHSILGIPHSASTGDVKKAYRALSKRFHPDHNRTEAAREIYIQVRRAYKALVDREAFEEEEAKNSHEFSIGVALPHFLTSREHDGLVLFSLLGILVLVPLFIWYKFSNDQKVPQLVWRIYFDKERVEHFMRHFGIPEDPKYVERRDSRKAIVQLLIKLQIIPPHAREGVVNAFPPYLDFLQRCAEMDKNKNYFRGLGLDDASMDALSAYMATNGVRLLDEYEAAHPPQDGHPGEVELLSPSAYKATRYLFQQHTMQVDAALLELQDAMGGNLSCARKLLNLHEEIYDLLDMLYSHDDKVNKQVVAKLIAVPQRVADIVDSVEPEIQLIYRRFYRNYLQQNGIKMPTRGSRRP